MATPNMATITASLERSLHNCSLNQQHSSSNSSSSVTGAGGRGIPSPSDSLPADSPTPTPTLELNSQASLPFHWEQCLDLKTGELYFINWRTGMKATEDPRVAAEYGGDYSAEEEDDSSSYDSDGSSTESSLSSSREQWSSKNSQENCYHQERNANSKDLISKNSSSNNVVLVVAGCKSCLMYHMVPKQLEICPKCCGQLLHFDRSEIVSS